MDFAKANPSVDCIDSTEGGQGCTGEKWMEFEQYCRDPEKVQQASAEINKGVSWMMKKVALNMGGTLFADLVSNAPSKCCDSSGPPHLVRMVIPQFMTSAIQLLHPHQHPDRVHQHPHRHRVLWMKSRHIP